MVAVAMTTQPRYVEPAFQQFSLSALPSSMGRSLGPSAVNTLPWIKNAFARHAAGLGGDKPRLMRGRSRAA